MPILQCVKVQRETAGLCCASGKVKLDPLLTPPQPLKTLFDGSDPDSSHFLQHILEYNNCFRMTSLELISLRRRLHADLQALERMPSDTHKICHRGLYPQQVNMCEDSMHPPMMLLQLLLAIQPNHDIVVQRSNIIMHRVNETHRLYDALQYPIIYWQGQDGYDITLKMVDPITEYWTTDDSPINHIGSPRHMHEYAQDAMTTIEFWVTHVVGYVPVEWQRGLPRSYPNLVAGTNYIQMKWMTSYQLEIPDPVTDPRRHDIVTTGRWLWTACGY
ncbi:hypothetical protein EVAR_49105_1 [Eumeta japonica]|uniref:Uncharacterized protein n=1 Tax=Eumeta variegata TaxID=151549 RepID=A0A4C1ZUN1_EUMVA|nr:hypothetical protein EVAR_49105_1 [Eumeta japonica]